jgi:DNA invertase Pin-like site-specific DNA recombinase
VATGDLNRTSGIEFVALDNPHASKLTIHILAAVAEHEREAISERTKAALAAAKARGKQVGTPGPRRRRRAHVRGPQSAGSAVRCQRAADHSRHPGGRLYKPQCHRRTAQRSKGRYR